MTRTDEDRLEAALRRAPMWIRRIPPLALNLAIALIAYALGRLSAPESWVEMRNGDMLETRSGRVCWVTTDGVAVCRQLGE